MLSIENYFRFDGENEAAFAAAGAFLQYLSRMRREGFDKSVFAPRSSISLLEALIHPAKTNSVRAETPASFSPRIESATGANHGLRPCARGASDLA
jgi:hypothetical protein